MALKPQEAYLHLITGGFDNAKRREVRKLFAAASSDASEEEDVTEQNFDLAVGLLEEFYSIGVKDFSLEQAMKTLTIFGINCLSTDELRSLLGSPRLRIHSSDDIWAVPDARHIETLRTSYCDVSKEALAKRSKEINLSLLVAQT